jgi:hypothetical protein
MNVGDIVRWTLPMHIGEGVYKTSPILGIIVKMGIGNGADVAWFDDNMRITWVPLLELQVISSRDI